METRSFYDHLNLGEADCELCNGTGLIWKQVHPVLSIRDFENPPTKDLIMSPDNKYKSWCPRCFAPDGPFNAFQRVCRVMSFFASIYSPSFDPKGKSYDYLDGFEAGGRCLLTHLYETFLANSPKFQANTGIPSKDMNDGFD